MPRDVSGNFTLVAGNPVVSGTVIEADWANTTLPDIGQALTDSLSRNGNGGMLSQFKATNGTVGLPGITFNNDLQTGLYLEGAGDVRMAALGANVMRWLNDTGTTRIETWTGSAWTRLITSASNLTGDEGVFSAIVAGDMQFKSLNAGTGMNFVSDANSITLNATPSSTFASPVEIVGTGTDAGNNIDSRLNFLDGDSVSGGTIGFQGSETFVIDNLRGGNVDVQADGLIMSSAGSFGASPIPTTRMYYSASLGLSLGGQGTTSDASILTRTGQIAFSIPSATSAAQLRFNNSERLLTEDTGILVDGTGETIVNIKSATSTPRAKIEFLNDAGTASVGTVGFDASSDLTINTVSGSVLLQENDSTRLQTESTGCRVFGGRINIDGTNTGIANNSFINFNDSASAQRGFVGAGSGADENIALACTAASGAVELRHPPGTTLDVRLQTESGGIRVFGDAINIQDPNTGNDVLAQVAFRNSGGTALGVVGTSDSSDQDAYLVSFVGRVKLAQGSGAASNNVRLQTSDNGAVVTGRNDLITILDVQANDATTNTTVTRFLNQAGGVLGSIGYPDNNSTVLAVNGFNGSVALRHGGVDPEDTRLQTESTGVRINGDGTNGTRLNIYGNFDTAANQNFIDFFGSTALQTRMGYGENTNNTFSISNFVGAIELRHIGNSPSDTRLQTTASGVDVTGDIDFSGSNNKIESSSGDLYLASSATGTLQLRRGAAVELEITASAITVNEDILPQVDNGIDLGSGGQRYRAVYAVSVVSPSDRELKRDVRSVDDQLLDAWQAVSYKLFKWRDGGERTELTNIGVIAQDIETVFREHGIDAEDYGFFEKADNTYNISPNQCAMLEAALMRRELKRLKSAILH